MAIDSKRGDLITTDSEVDLDRKYGVGVPVIRVRRSPIDEAETPARKIEPGEVIPRFREDQDTVENMAGKIETASDSVDSVARDVSQSLNETINPAFSASQETLESVQATSDAIRPEAVDTLQQIRASTINLENEMTTLAQRVDRLVENQVRSTVDQINEAAVAAADAAESMQKLAEGLDAKSETTNDDIRKTLDVMRETALLIQQLTQETREVVRIVRSEADDLPGTTARVNDTVSETQELVGDIRDHWLLRRYRSERESSQQVSPSSLRGGVR